MSCSNSKLSKKISPLVLHLWDGNTTMHPPFSLLFIFKYQDNAITIFLSPCFGKFKNLATLVQTLPCTWEVCSTPTPTISPSHFFFFLPKFLLNPLVSQLHQDMAGPPSLGTNPCTTPWPNPKLFPGPSYLFPTEAQPEPGHQQTAPSSTLN
jgi:hypothetical protein